MRNKKFWFICLNWVLILLIVTACSGKQPEETPGADPVQSDIPSDPGTSEPDVSEPAGPEEPDPDTPEGKLMIMEQNFTAMKEIVPEIRIIDEYQPTGDFEGIQAITYEGPEYCGQKTKVFAYLGFPEGASEEAPVPAVVLIHGGQGHPFVSWVKSWNDQGYAAIAMSLTGDFPTAVNAGEYEACAEQYTHGLYGIFEEDGYIDAPDNSGWTDCDKPITEQWMYQAIAQTILAGNILRSDTRVDAGKMGMMGISWGGIIDALTMGYDNRFAFSVPVYGSAHLDTGRAIFGTMVRNQEMIQKLWTAQDRFETCSDIATLWQCWDTDPNFSIDENSLCYSDMKGYGANAVLSIVKGMNHSHMSSWARQPKEVFVFADSVVKGTAALPQVEDLSEGRDIVCRITAPEGIKINKIRIFYLTEPLSYHTDQNGEYTVSEKWTGETMLTEGDTATFTLPDEAKAYYIAVTDSRSTIVSSPYREIGD